jgi:magnesium transporter
MENEPESRSDPRGPTPEDLHEVWVLLSLDERVSAVEHLGRGAADEFFLQLSSTDQAQLLLARPTAERLAWMRLLAPDDAADLIQEAPPEERAAQLALLDEPTRREVSALLAYAEDAAGGLMSPRFARVRPEMSVDEAIAYVRKQMREHVETTRYIYVIDAGQRLLGVVALRELFAAAPATKVMDVMRRSVITVPEQMDQEEVSRLFTKNHLLALPVVDAEGRIKGVVTLDDIVDVVEEEATEDIQKLGGVQALGAPYLQVGIGGMIKKRAGWLAALFLGEMLTATAMSYFEGEIARAVVLALFVPLIISSGGNSGSQATTLVIRAMALQEIRLADWWRVVRREIAAGLALGVILGTIGLTRILIWEAAFHVYGEHALKIGLTVAVSLLGVVLWGTLAGSMLPFVLRRIGVDPASASAPLVATLVDVSGLVIYFTVASVVLRGTLL